MSGINAPERQELYVLEDDEKPVEVTEDTKIPNAATIKVVKQDHTLGNMLRGQLLLMPQVLFAGYKVPHPLHPYFQLKVQTDGSISPRDALEEAAMKLIVKIQHMEQGFKTEFALKSTDGTGAVAGGVDEPYGAGSGSTWNAGRGYMDF